MFHFCRARISPATCFLYLNLDLLRFLLYLKLDRLGLRCAGEMDPRCPIKGLEETLTKVAAVYKTAGVPEHFKVTSSPILICSLPTLPFSPQAIEEANGDSRCDGARFKYTTRLGRVPTTSIVTSFTRKQYHDWGFAVILPVTVFRL